MSRIFVSNWISIDGVFSGAGGDTNWFTSDEELKDYNLHQLHCADTILFGRTTYELMHAYWPTEQAKRDYPDVHRYMNECRKHIFSHTVNSSDWQSCYFHNAVNKEAIEKIRADTNKNIVILGSGEIATQLHNLGLIDEYHILLDPQILGEGRRFFDETTPVRLKLESMKKFNCGVAYLRYSVVK